MCGDCDGMGCCTGNQIWWGCDKEKGNDAEYSAGGKPKTKFVYSWILPKADFGCMYSPASIKTEFLVILKNLSVFMSQGFP